MPHAPCNGGDEGSDDRGSSTMARKVVQGHGAARPRFARIGLRT